MKSACPSLLGVALVVLVAAIGLPHSMAGELPADPNKIESLTPEQAGVLSQRKGSLKLNNLTTLSAEAAKALAAAEKWDGNLPALTAVDSPDSVAVTQALAARKGRLSLTKLKKISPKTLAALIQKEDVEIPFIETLELISEPDGSATDDFVIPEWLEEREKQKRFR